MLCGSTVNHNCSGGNTSEEFHLAGKPTVEPTKLEAKLVPESTPATERNIMEKDDGSNIASHHNIFLPRGELEHDFQGNEVRSSKFLRFFFRAIYYYCRVRMKISKNIVLKQKLRKFPQC